MDTPLARRADALDELALEALLELLQATPEWCRKAEVDEFAAPLLVTVRAVRPRGRP